MAKSATGKWVSRVAASGGGKSYKKTRPANYYGAIALIVILGLLATVYARYEYQHPSTAAASNATPPAIGTTWYAGLSIQACGTTLPYLNPDPTFKGGFVVQAKNVIRVSPVAASDAGSHATLAQFANEFPGLIASSTQLAVPTKTGAANAATTYRNGQTCPAGTKDAGQTGKITYAYWPYGATKPTVTTDPSSIKFSQYMTVTMAFEPAGVTPTKPAQATITAMVSAGVVGTTTTTLAPSVTTTTLPSTTTTVTGSTTTTAPKG